MSTEVVKEAKLEEEPRQCTKKEKLGHAIGVLGHDSMYTLWSTWTTPFLTDILKLPAGLGVPSQGQLRILRIGRCCEGSTCQFLYALFVVLMFPTTPMSV